MIKTLDKYKYRFFCYAIRLKIGILLFMITLIIGFDFCYARKSHMSSFLSSLSHLTREISPRLNKKPVECGFSTTNNSLGQNSCTSVLSTLEEYLSTKNLKISDLRSELAVSEWTTMISPVCLANDKRIFTFSTLSMYNIKLFSLEGKNQSFQQDEDLKRSFWQNLHNNWRIIQNMTNTMVSRKSRLILGRTFLTTGDRGNIGHCLQRLACDAAAAIGSLTSPYNTTINWEQLGENVPSLVVKAIGDALSDLQSPSSLIRFDDFQNSDILCFEHLVFHRPTACGPHSLLKFPSNQKETLARIRSMLFQRTNLPRLAASINPHTKTSCVKHVLIYDRGNTNDRRFLNAQTLQNRLAINRCLNVTLIHNIPASSREQGLLINSADLFVTPHGATAYLSFFLPDSAWLIEIGLVTWVRGALMPYFPLSYRFVNFGLDLIQYNPEFDRAGPRESERSFSLNKTGIDVIQAIVQSHACSCNK